MGLYPIKWETALNASALITDKKLIIKCCNRKISKNKPVNAIRNLRAMDTEEKDDLLMQRNIFDVNVGTNVTAIEFNCSLKRYLEVF